MNTVIAVDPGTEQSAIIAYPRRKGHYIGCSDAEILSNNDLIERIHFYADWARCNTRHGNIPAYFAIEQVRSYGMAIGATTLDTVEWSGRFIQAWLTVSVLPEESVLRIPRIEIKSHLCHSGRAKDANVRQALIDRLGEPGTKKNPGPTYGIKSHLWSALAVATTAYDKIKENE